jgi:hypothetical protein
MNLSNDTISNCDNSIEKKSKKTAIDYSKEFDEFWIKYPKKAAKPKAFEAYKKARQKASHEKIMEGLTKYAQIVQDQKFIKHPQGWLNDGRWEDEYPTVATMQSNKAPYSSGKASILEQQREAARRFQEDLERRYGEDAVL